MAARDASRSKRVKIKMFLAANSWLPCLRVSCPETMVHCQSQTAVAYACDSPAPGCQLVHLGSEVEGDYKHPYSSQLQLQTLHLVDGTDELD